MNITFLGTGSAEMYPSVFCDCPHCSAARAASGKNIRGNSSALIDNDLLIDLNSTGLMRASLYGISLTGLKGLLITHPHPDHFSPSLLKWRRAPKGDMLPFTPENRDWSARYTELAPMTVIGTQSVWDGIHEYIPNPSAADYTFSFLMLRPLKIHAFADYRIIPIPSNHGKIEGFSHSYLIEKDNKNLLYALDTGGFRPEILSFIYQKHFDAVVLDGTFGLKACDSDDLAEPTGKGHMNLRANILFRDRLLENGCITRETPFILSHICPHFSPPHDEYEAIVRQQHMILAYDGMKLLL